MQMKRRLAKASVERPKSCRWHEDAPREGRHGNRSPRSNRARPANRQHPPPHLPVLRSDQAQVRAERSGAGIMGVPETPPGGTRPDGGGSMSEPNQADFTR